MFLTKVTFHGEELKTSRVYYSIREGNAWTDPAIVQGLPDSFIVKNPMPESCMVGMCFLFYRCTRR
jgi:hypothetical protein